MVIFEGGKTLNRVQAYIAKIFEAGAPTPCEGTGVDAPPEAFLLKAEAVWLGERICCWNMRCPVKMHEQC